MRIFRIVVAGLMLAVILAGGTVALALHNQARIIRLVLARIYVETGYNIVPSGARIAFRSHLVLLLQKPHIYLGGDEVAQLDDVRAVVSYHAIFYSSGLPLHALALDHPIVRIPASVAGVTPHGLPKPDVEAVARLKWALDAISDVAQRVEIVDAALSDEDGTPLIDHLTLTAYRQHRRPGNWPWIVKFDAGWKHAPFDGLVVVGNIRLGAASGVASNVVAAGQLSFHGLDLAPFNGPYGIRTSGQMAGSLRFALRQDGELIGDADSNVSQIVLKGKPFTAPIALGDYVVHTIYAASTQRVELKEFTVTQHGAPLLAGGGTVGQPYDDARTAAIHVEGVRVGLTQVASWMRSLRAIPAPLNDFARRFTAGQIALSTVAFDPRGPVADWSARMLRENLRIQATLSGAGFDPPGELKLPPIRCADAALAYAGGIVTLTQGSAALGKSTLSGITGAVNINGAPELLSYKVRSKGNLDAGELYPALAGILTASEPGLAGRIGGVAGKSAIELNASGKIENMVWSVPANYTLKIVPDRVEFAIKGAPSAIAIKGGELELRPGSVEINQLAVAPVAPQTGNAALNGTIVAARPYPIFRNFVAELHELPAETWLPLMLDPQQIGVKGAVGGRLVAQTDPQKGGAPVITGRLTMGPGELQFGFLRSPIVAKSATVALDGKGMKLDMPAGELEGHPVDLAIALADFTHPMLRLDATSGALDFEVMRFIRMPWSPRTPIAIFELPIEGHIAANRAIFGKLLMSSVGTDFDRVGGEWHVRNFTAKSLEGSVKLDLSGRTGPDNWIHMKARVDGMNAAALSVLIGQDGPPLTGRLTATGDLWGNTDVDFFSTLKGNASIKVEKGTLNRFALLTRVLSFIDLKNWLTAHFPDPRVAGIPFDTLKGTFNGTEGNFDTKDLRLSGPVMEITASGAVRLSDGTMDMEISLIPFGTVNWLVQHIPIIGKNLASGSKDLVAAYFQVRGPINNPSVMPKPITSVAEFVAKTLSLPINIIAPETIKP